MFVNFQIFENQESAVRDNGIIFKITYQGFLLASNESPLRHQML